MQVGGIKERYRVDSCNCVFHVIVWERQFFKCWKVSSLTIFQNYTTVTFALKCLNQGPEDNMLQTIFQTHFLAIFHLIYLSHVLSPQNNVDPVNWYIHAPPGLSEMTYRPVFDAGNIPDSKVHGANMEPIWGRQDPGGPHVGPMNLAIWDVQQSQLVRLSVGDSSINKRQCCLDVLIYSIRYIWSFLYCSHNTSRNTMAASCYV